MSLIEWRQIANKSEDLNTDYEKETHLWSDSQTFRNDTDAVVSLFIKEEVVCWPD